MNTEAADQAESGFSVEIEPQNLVETFIPREYPGQVGLWRAALQIPEPVEFSSGGIAMPKEYRDDVEFATYVGNVRSMGPLCFQSETRGGVPLADDHGFKVGDWVQFGKRTGEKFRTADGTLWVVISETQYIAVISDPTQFDCMSL